MSESWDDFHRPSNFKPDCSKRAKTSHIEPDPSTSPGAGCDWGINDQGGGPNNQDQLNSKAEEFALIYERYLSDRSILPAKTANHDLYLQDPERQLHEWFLAEAGELSIKTDNVGESGYISSIDLPIEGLEFALSSELHRTKKDSMVEVCMIGCKLLDECDLLANIGLDSERAPGESKRIFNDANKEDDIEFDSTSKRNEIDRNKRNDKATVNTYESLLKQWNELSSRILNLKATLAKLETSSSVIESKLNEKAKSNKRKAEESCEEDDNDEEIDPLDEFMSNLEANEALEIKRPSIDDKIKRSQLKLEIKNYEKEQEKVACLLKLATPKFDLNKKYPTTAAAGSSKSNI